VRSKKLARQIKKSLGLDDLENSISVLVAELSKLDGLSEESKTTVEALKNIPLFLDAIEASYVQQEKLLDVANRSLEISSKELNQSNKESAVLNSSMRALMNSLGQGFLVFDRSGICGSIFSKACLGLLETDPVSQPLAEVLKIPADKRKDFEAWIELLFSGTMDFEDLVILGPRRFPHSQGRSIALEFKPIRNSREELEGVVLIVSDNTYS
jgi:hypothetical protein